MTPKPPTRKQLNYLKALAHRCGQTFTYPHTSAQASREIRRLQTAKPIDPVEAFLETFDLEAENAARELNGDVPVRADEISGHGSTATWSQRA